MSDLAAHADHKWVQSGRCVCCADCEVLLYQGKIPKDRAAFATAFDDITKAAVRAITAREKAKKK